MRDIANGRTVPALTCGTEVVKSANIIDTRPAIAVREGLVASLNHPGGNVTGVNFLTGAIGTKRLDLLRQLAPKGAPIGVLLQAGTAQAEAERKEVEAAAATLSQPISVVEVRSDQEIIGAITRLADQGARALLVGSGPFLYSHRNLAIAAASR